MQRMNRAVGMLAGALVAAGLLAACGQTPSAAASKVAPAMVETGAEGINRLKLTEKAAQRLNIQTAPVREELVDGAQRKIIPYAAVLYDLQGKTWAYTSPETLTFVRQAITIDHIDGDRVILADGPPAGTAIVTLGVAELYGTDTGIGK